MRKCLCCETSWSGLDWQCPNCQWQPSLLEGFSAFAPELAEGNDGFRQEFHQQFASCEAKCFWFSDRNRLLVLLLRRYFPGAKEFLEVGCGTGFVLDALRAAFAGLHLVGGEIFVSGLRLARARLPQIELLQMDGRRIPYTEEFDVIGIFDVLEHIDQDLSVLAQIRQALKPGGGLLLTVPQHRWLWSRHDEANFHKRRYTRRELRTKLERAGFRVRWMTSFVSLLLPLMVVARCLPVLGKSADGAQELQLPELPVSLNNLLAGICQVERNLISRGLSLPLGGSLLAVAERD